MKRATMSFPDELAVALEEYRSSQENPPSLTKIVQSAVREYLRERGFLRPRRALKLTALGSSGRRDVSKNHDLYLAGIKK
jgi:hypothetical protein